MTDFAPVTATTTNVDRRLIVLSVPDDPVKRGYVVGAALKTQIIELFHRWCSSCDDKMNEEPGTMEVRALSYATSISIKRSISKPSCLFITWEANWLQLAVRGFKKQG